MSKIALYVNGRACEVEVEPKTTLLEVLRDQLHLTGTKNGCNQGHCGACTVIINGKAVRSCTFLARRAEGARVRTIEGLAKEGKLHPLQRAFVEHGAIQCGFCTPGMIMSAVALLESNPSPSRQEILQALSHNLCRCTGYERIIAAIESLMQPAPVAVPAVAAPLAVVGRPLPRPDAIAKATGAATFAADLSLPGMLFAKVLRSQYPHARLLGIDTTRAQACPGVVRILTHPDVPGRQNHGVVRPDWPVFASNKVRYLGDAIALVVAESERQAEEALQQIRVDYEPLPVIGRPEEALAAGAVAIHEDGNLLKHIVVTKGQVDEAFGPDLLVVEREYYVPSADHAFLEPEAALATVDEGGNVLVYVGSQIPFGDQQQIAASLDLPVDQVRVIQTSVGGAFGGKEDIAAQIHVALAAWLLKRPVKLVYTRQESMIAHPKRHSARVHLKTAARPDGRVVAVQAEILGDAGAYASLSEPVMTRTATHAAGPYEIPNVAIDCKVAYTNNVPTGAFRGFGVPQSNFAIESQMDIMARELGISPLEIRRRNALRVGSATATGQVLRESVGLLQTLDQVETFVRQVDGQADILRPCGAPASPVAGPWVRAWGAASAYKNTGLGGGIPDSAGAVVELCPDCRVRVRAGAAEIGQGVVGVVAQIAAEELGVEYEQVDVLLADTALTPDGGATTASRQTFITGNAVRLAAGQVRHSLLSAASEELQVPPDSLILRNGRVTAGDRSISLASAINLAINEGRTLTAQAIYTAPPTVRLGEPGDAHIAFSFATQAAQVEVNTETGEVKVLRIVAAHDIGRVINPLALSGQIEGGVMMGLSLALFEEFKQVGGIPQATTLAKYHLAKAADKPEITVLFVEEPVSTGPYGAKGVGEITLIPTAAAITNAIFNATGGRIYSLPATPQRVLETLRR